MSSCEASLLKQTISYSGHSHGKGKAMKKVLSLLALVGLFALVGYAATPTAGTYDGMWFYKSSTAYQTLDSLKTVSDSMIIFSNFSPDVRGQYILAFGATVANSDSVRYQIVLDEYDYYGRLLGRVTVDSVSTKYSKQVVLPFNETAQVGSATCKIIASTGAASKQKVSAISLIKRENVQLQKN